MKAALAFSRPKRHGNNGRRRWLWDIIHYHHRHTGYTASRTFCDYRSYPIEWLDVTYIIKFCSKSTS